MSRLAAVLSAGLLALGLMTVMVSPATAAPASAAEYNPKCPTGVTQIGATGYVKYGNETAVSITETRC